MDKIEASYLDTIFAAIPVMNEFEKGRLYGTAEEILRRKSEKDSGTHTGHDELLEADLQHNKAKST